MTPIETIISRTSRETLIAAEVIKGPRKSNAVVKARWSAIKKARLAGHSLTDIGDAFGGRHHTTILHACREMGLQ